MKFGDRVGFLAKEWGRKRQGSRAALRKLAATADDFLER